MMDISTSTKLLGNGLSERNVNFIDDPSNVAIDFSRKVVIINISVYKTRRNQIYQTRTNLE